MPPFEDITVSTKTVIAHTNATYSIQRLFELLPIHPYAPPPRRRGRQQARTGPDPKDELPGGAIVTLKFFQHHRGIDLKAKKKNTKYFRNALSVVMKVGDKLINFKLSKNGKFQMTGVKTNDHAVKCVKYLWKYILDLEDHTLYSISAPSLEVIVKVVMTNIDFSLGFKVDRESLDRYFNSSTDYHSLLETSFGYTGVNIKFPSPLQLDEDLRRHTMDVGSGDWTEDTIKMKDYLDRLPPANQSKELNKRRFNTFLVFHSGNVIMSGSVHDQMKSPYYNFLQIIKDCKTHIEETLLPPLADDEVTA